MAENIEMKKNFVSIDAMVDELDKIHGDKEKRIVFENFYKSFVVEALENILSNQNGSMKKMVEETEVLSLIIKEKSKGFEEIAKEIYVMGQFEGMYDVLGTWCKMYFDNLEYEKTMTKVMSKKHVPEIVYCIRKQPGIQNKRILEIVNVKPNHLSELTSELIYHQIISRYSVGKNTFYELTPRAKDFFEKKEKREYHIRLKKNKMEMYIALGADEEVTEHDYRSQYFEEFRECTPMRVQKEYVLDEIERSIYYV